jgi:hypothetical protein
MIGAPEEMVGIYTAIFGNEDILRDRILNAISAFEGKDTAAEPTAAQDEAPQQQRRRVVFRVS